MTIKIPSSSGQHPLSPSVSRGKMFIKVTVVLCAALAMIFSAEAAPQPGGDYASASGRDSDSNAEDSSSGDKQYGGITYSSSQPPIYATATPSSAKTQDSGDEGPITSSSGHQGVNPALYSGPILAKTAYASPAGALTHQAPVAYAPAAAALPVAYQGLGFAARRPIYYNAAPVAAAPVPATAAVQQILPYGQLPVQIAPVQRHQLSYPTLVASGASGSGAAPGYGPAPVAYSVPVQQQQQQQQHYYQPVPLTYSPASQVAHLSYNNVNDQVQYAW